jgi:hypothetical protein
MPELIILVFLHVTSKKTPKLSVSAFLNFNKP